MNEELKKTVRAVQGMEQYDESVNRYWHTKSYWQVFLYIILLGLAKNLPPYTEKNKLHRLLGALFTNELTADEKISIIESEYNIEAKNELRKDVRKVSGLGESLVESAAEEAWEQSKIKFIINMNEKGYTIEQIADVTEKSREEVEAVLEKEK